MRMPSRISLAISDIEVPDSACLVMMYCKGSPSSADAPLEPIRHARLDAKIQCDDQENGN